jgi:hypothetical protein
MKKEANEEADLVIGKISKDEGTSPKAKGNACTLPSL